MIIKVGNKRYVGQCNALSYIFHNRLFKKNIIKELNGLRECFIKLDKEATEDNMTNIYNILIRVIYTFMYTYDNSIYSINEFKEDIKDEIITTETISEIVELLIENFIDIEVSRQLEKINSNNTGMSIFPEHDFLISCLQLKLTINDLKILTYIDVMKMLILTLNIENEDKDYRKATQNDIDKLLM